MISRGIRNNNPANIRHGCKWRGLRTTQTDSQFCQFVIMYYGIRALIITLRTYVTAHGLHTIPQIISRWAPPSDHNHTDEYIKYVNNKMAEKLGKKNVELYIEDFMPKSCTTLMVLCQAMCMMESGYKLSDAEFMHVLRTMK